MENRSYGLYSLYRLYRGSIEESDTDDTKAALIKCGDLLENVCKSNDTFNVIWDAICEYGDQRDYQGYIEGFNQAVQIAIDLKNKT